MRNVLIDTGPLVGFLNARDTYHRWARDVLSHVTPPPPDVRSSAFGSVLLGATTQGRSGGGARARRARIVEVTFYLEGELAPVRKLMTRYANTPMALADACLVRMTEIDPKAIVLRKLHEPFPRLPQERPTGRSGTAPGM